MHSAPWQFEKSSAALHLGALSANLASSQPDDGLTNVIVGENPLAQARLLGIALGQVIEAADAVECYVRGADMIVVYEESSRWPVRVDAVWRAVAATAPAEVLAAVDLIVSVRTHLLDMRPDLAVESIVPAGDVFRLSDSRSAACEPLALADQRPTVLSPATGPGCFLFRFPDAQFSYIEMVHPDDFEHDEIGRRDTGDGSLRATHRLFRASLEKGVILRARVRGVFVDRRDDARTAAACYAAFAAADPPLGT
jgi:hypothetical protein